METQKLNIYQKLHAIQTRIIGLGKDKKSFSYDYVTGSKVLEHIKPLMNEFGLLLKQEVISSTNTRIDYQTKSGSKTEILTKLDMRFTWVDIDTGEKDENLFGANGQNDYEKGYGSALTYSERYFLLKYFHIATDEDDIDNPDRKTTPPVQVDYKAALEACDSLESLKNVFTSIPKEVKPQFEAIKDNMKDLLTIVKELGEKKTLIALDAYEASLSAEWKENAKIKALIDKIRLKLTA